MISTCNCQQSLSFDSFSSARVGEAWFVLFLEKSSPRLSLFIQRIVSRADANNGELSRGENNEAVRSRTRRNMDREPSRLNDWVTEERKDRREFVRGTPSARLAIERDSVLTSTIGPIVRGRDIAVSSISARRRSPPFRSSGDERWNKANAMFEETDGWRRKSLWTKSDDNILWDSNAREKVRSGSLASLPEEIDRSRTRTSLGWPLSLGAIEESSTKWNTFEGSSTIAVGEWRRSVLILPRRDRWRSVEESPPSSDRTSSFLYLGTKGFEWEE